MLWPMSVVAIDARKTCIKTSICGKGLQIEGQPAHVRWLVSEMPMLTLAIMCAGSYSKVLYRNHRESTKIMVLVVEGRQMYEHTGQLHKRNVI